MSTRRKFLGQTLLGSAGLIAAPQLQAAGFKENPKDSPIVISTWSSGKVANDAAWKVLDKNGYAIDAVEVGVKVIEADPKYNTVGYGGLPDRDGRVSLDACIMDEKYQCGAVMSMEHIMHPISVARLVMEKTPHIYLTGEGALKFALANGFKKENLLTPESEKAWKEWMKTSHYAPQKNIENKYDKTTDPMPGGKDNHDTIGMLAMDAQGRMSGACTTSGLAYKMQGRVGDSPIIGAGLYVDNEVGAATASGVGEEVIRIVGAHTIVELMRNGATPEDACKAAVLRLIKANPEKAKTIQVAFLAMNNAGQHGAYALQQGFTYAVKTNTEETIIKSKSIY